SKVDMAAVYELKVLLHIVKSENPQAIDSALACLKLFGIDIPAHPSWEQVQAEYATVWRNLDGRPIEDLIDLPLMQDPEVQAATRLLCSLSNSAYVTDRNLFCLQLCRTLNLSMRHGVNGASAHACGYLGFSLGPAFQRYPEGFRLAKLGCDLVEKHGFLAYRAKVQDATAIAAFWTHPLATAIDFVRASIRTATGTGDLTYACYGMLHIVMLLLLRNDPLDAVWRESEIAQDFVHKSRFSDIENIIIPYQRFIAAMQGRTAALSTFNDAQFDEAAFEAQLLADDRMPTKICWYWIVKAKARFLSGDYAEALAAADHANAMLWSSTAHFPLLDYYYYTALTLAALYKNASADERNGWRKRLAVHQAQLREWADNYSPTFADKHALVSAEIARVEGRNADAMRLYDEAIEAAHEHGFVQNEGIAHELAAGFYADRGATTAARAHLDDARSCFARWGAHGKVRQLDARMPPSREASASPAATLPGNVAQLDLLSVTKASQAISGQIVLEDLIDTLMHILLENAGAQTGQLMLLRNERLVLAAEASVERQTVHVRRHLNQTPPAAAPTEPAWPASIVNYARRCQERVLLDDATQANPFSADDYFARRQPKSVLCLPLVRLSALIGLLYLENNLVTHAFTPERVTVLELLASQAAITLENARLYRDLAEREARIRRLVDANIVGIFIWDLAGEILEANDAFLRIVGYDRADLVSGRVRWTDLTPPEWLACDKQRTLEVEMAGTVQPYEKEFSRKDGSRAAVLIGAAKFEERGSQGVAFVLDLTERKRAQAEARDSERRYREVQMELAHSNRAATMGQLTASIAHEVQQPIAAAAVDASAALRWLRTNPPNLEEVRQSVDRIGNETMRAGGIVGRIRDLIKKAPPRKDRVDINEAVREVIELTQGEAAKNGVSMLTVLDDGLPLVPGDRVQLQQVMLNLIVNAIEAMSATSMGPRELLISTAADSSNGVSIAVRDSGPGLPPVEVKRVFDPFYTTKAHGLGMGLSICRSIVEAHGGRLWASANAPRGAAFQLVLPRGEVEQAPSSENDGLPGA
ncbi:MAG: hypothetical protein QOJ04_4503, partial [Caballeronia sp.]|nr:hypothetical protein [Caballeronia sp.]